MATTSIKFGDFDSAQGVLRDIRSDSSPTNWVVYTYSDDDTLNISGSGTGDVEELKPLLLPTGRSYAFIRVIDYVDNHRTIKFVFIVWAGDRVPVVKRARMATHKGSITSFIGQFHISIDASSADEISTDLVMERVRDASGSGSRVKSGGSAVDAHMAPQASHIHDQVPEPAPVVATAAPVQATRSTPTEPKKVATSAATRVAHPSVPKGSQGVQFPDREVLDAAIRAVRSDTDPTTWALFGYQGDTDNLELVGQGEGDIDSMTELLQDDKINYGLLRTTDRFDGHLTVKFVFLVWIGERVKIMRKARIATHKGAIVTFVGQYHTDLEATKHEEVTQEEVRRKVQFAAGTAVHVKSS